MCVCVCAWFQMFVLEIDELRGTLKKSDCSIAFDAKAESMVKEGERQGRECRLLIRICNDAKKYIHISFRIATTVA